MITRLARSVAHNRAVALTRSQRIGRAVLWMCLGATCFAIGAAVADAGDAPATLMPRQPVIEVDKNELYIVRFPFEYRGREVSCWTVLQAEGRQWLAKC